MNCRQAFFFPALAMLLLSSSLVRGLPLVALTGLEDDPSVILVDARTKLKQGMLAEAESRLVEVPIDAPANIRASAQLLLGNVAFERGDYLAAGLRYESAVALYATDGPVSAGISDGLAAARSNQDLVRQHLARRLVLSKHSNRLILVTACVLALAASSVLITRWVLLR